MKFFAYTLFFISMLVVFIPKASIYYLLETSLKKFDILISNERLTDNIISLNISHLDISAKAVDVAFVKSVDVTLLGAYMAVDVEGVKLSSLVESYLPSKIDSVHISYSLVDPLHLNAEAEGAFGTANATLSLLDKNASVVLLPSKKMLQKHRSSLRFFKRNKDGEYVYAKNI